MQDGVETPAMAASLAEKPMTLRHVLKLAISN